MSGRPVKRSLTLRGHRTSVSLEDAFWRAFREMAEARGMPLNALAAEIDAGRGDVGLASAIRVFVLEAVARRAAQGPISHSRSSSE
ncbi:MAG: ribbon-helix-helix domain-containing protein [Paracoccaceae bacterium]|nr:ribbon-helix-helix domain-containing protein [Paracoccaceae bacterium]